jgi:hypothetical protein
MARGKLEQIQAAAGLAEAESRANPPKPHPAFGALKGMIRIVAGTDLTEPADPDWGKRLEDPDWGKPEK